MHHLHRFHFPFTAIVGQETLRRALTLSAVYPRIGGLLVRGERGSVKTTAARGLTEVLPEIEIVDGCPFNCHPTDQRLMCEQCATRQELGEELPSRRRQAPFVTTPTGVSGDELFGAIDLPRSHEAGQIRIHPGLLATANRGVLYIDGVEELDGQLLDHLLEVAATGRNIVDRDGLTAVHPAHFSLIGATSLPEGLRPERMDRFGMSVTVEAVGDLDQRVEILARNDEFERDPSGVANLYDDAQLELTEQISVATERVDQVVVGADALRSAAQRVVTAGIEGHRADLTLLKVSRALAALLGDTDVDESHLERASELVLPHRLPLQLSATTSMVPPPEVESARDSASPSVSLRNGAAGNAGRPTLPSPVATPPAPTPSAKTKPLIVLPEPDIARRARQRNKRVRDEEPPPKTATPVGRAICFLVDAGSSTSAAQRLDAVRHAAEQLLSGNRGESYLVSVVAAQGGKGHLRVVLTDEIERVGAALDWVKPGGKTPLAHSLVLASQELQRARERNFAPTLVVLTEGRSDVPLTVGGDPGEDAVEATRMLAEKSFDSLVVYTKNERSSSQLALKMADRLGADFLEWEAGDAKSPIELGASISGWVVD